VLARITGARKGAIVDALYDDDACDRLLAVVEKPSEVPTTLGSVEGIRVLAQERRVPLDVPEPHRWVRGGTDQSNSIAFVSDRYALKLFRRVEPTLNPEFEIGRFLTQRGFTRTPELAGALQYLRPGLEPGTLAVVQAVIKHQGSGWDFSINELRRYYERITPRVSGPEGSAFATPPSGPAVPLPEQPPAAASMPRTDQSGSPPPFFHALENWYLSAAATLGRRTAEMHRVLASGDGAGFAP
jgi:trehalose synthase-fused probable maltokinase